ncbi:hypothetical protein [Streptomyces sp. WM6378]
MAEDQGEDVALAAPDGTVLPAAALQTAALTAITDLFGIVVAKVDDLPE